MSGKKKRLLFIGTEHRFEYAEAHAEFALEQARTSDADILCSEQRPGANRVFIPGDYVDYFQKVSFGFLREGLPYANVEGITPKMMDWAYGTAMAMLPTVVSLGLLSLDTPPTSIDLRIMLPSSILFGLVHGAIADLVPIPCMYLAKWLRSDWVIPMTGMMRNRFFCAAIKKVLEEYDSAVVLTGSLHTKHIIRRINDDLIPSSSCFHPDFPIYSPDGSMRIVQLRTGQFINSNRRV